MSFKRTTIFTLLLSASLLGACSQTDNNPAVNTANNSADNTADNLADDIARFINTDAGIAIKGTDPVAYFTEGEPTPGSEEFAYEWNGVTWHFTSAENRDRFSAAPEQYAPQYGGYCAWAASQGNVADIDPAAWTIVDDKLYLNYSLAVQERWEKDIPGHIAAADAQWPTVVQENL